VVGTVLTVAAPAPAAVPVPQRMFKKFCAVGWIPVFFTSLSTFFFAIPSRLIDPTLYLTSGSLLSLCLSFFLLIVGANVQV